MVFDRPGVGKTVRHVDPEERRWRTQDGPGSRSGRRKAPLPAKAAAKKVATATKRATGATAAKSPGGKPAPTSPRTARKKAVSATAAPSPKAHGEGNRREEGAGRPEGDDRNSHRHEGTRDKGHGRETAREEEHRCEGAGEEEHGEEGTDQEDGRHAGDGRPLPLGQYDAGAQGNDDGVVRQPPQRPHRCPLIGGYSRDRRARKPRTRSRA